MDTVVYSYKPAPGPLNNPLKGWCPYTDSDLYLPYSMVYRYVSWRELEPKEGEYRFAEWEQKTWDSDPKSPGKHIIFRVYIDYPGKISGLPNWIRAKGVSVASYVAKDMEFYEPGAAKGESPDYENPVFVAALEKLIAALGTRYDSHPRIAFIQLGLLGFWGEWHTYPFTKLFASEATQKRVLHAYKLAFPNKKLMARYGDGEPGECSWLGFHDDYFPDDTGYGEDWYFLSRLRKAGRLNNWRTAGFGGEMVPNAAGKWIGTDAGFQTTREMVEQAHFSWVGPYSPAMAPEAKNSESFRQRCHALVRRMGYQYCLTQLSLPRLIRREKLFALLLTGKNEGVAPFYYPWQVEIALLTGSNIVVETVPLRHTDIRQWQPGGFRLSEQIRFMAPPGHYQIALGMRDPWTKRPTIRFASEIMTTKDGWNILAPVTLSA